MSNTHNIEKSILASVLNSEIECDLKSNYFNDMFHRKLVQGINRMKELGEYIDFEILRNKFMKANKWSFSEDEKLIELMTTTTPFSTKQIFDEYYRILEKSYVESFDKRFAI